MAEPSIPDDKAARKAKKKAYLAAYYMANRNRIKAKSQAWRVANKDRHLANARNWYARNPERVNERPKAWAATNKERAAVKRRIRERRYRDESPEEFRAYQRKWYAEHIKERRVKKKAWRASNPTGAKLSKARRKGALVGHFTNDDIIKIRALQKDRCAYCRRALKEGGEVDHIIPISKGGANYPCNLQLTCKPCNASKQDADPIAFARRLGKVL